MPGRDEKPIRATFHFREIVLGALLTVAASALGAILFFLWGQASQQARVVDWLTHDAAGFFTVWLVGVGAVQLRLFYVQLKFIRQSVVDAEQLANTAQLQAEIANATLKSSQDTAKRQLRAYVGHEPGGAHFEAIYNNVSSKYEDTGPVKYFERNYGQTPAINLRMHVRVVDGLNAPDDFERDVPRVEVMQTVFPGQGVGKIVDRSKKRDHKFFLYGYIDYDDVFGGKWRRRFAFTHDPSRPGKGDDKWVAHHANNDEYQRP